MYFHVSYLESYLKKLLRGYVIQIWYVGYTKNGKRGWLDVFFCAIKEYEGSFMWGIFLGQAQLVGFFSPSHHDSYLKKPKVKVHQNRWERISPSFGLNMKNKWNHHLHLPIGAEIQALPGRVQPEKRDIHFFHVCWYLKVRIPIQTSWKASTLQQVKTATKFRFALHFLDFLFVPRKKSPKKPGEQFHRKYDGTSCRSL